jgi:3-isopropylmalate/(R)-2-methylmalate dehydratase large subunit
MTKLTLFDKIWNTHIVEQLTNDLYVLYIDKHLIHEVTSPQAFDELEKRNIPIFRPRQIIATADHNVPTINQHLPIEDDESRMQVQKLSENCNKYHIELFGLGHKFQGIIHVIAPELGITQPGMTIVCGDSHTSTHGAFGTIAFGIGTSQVAQVFASQCLILEKPKKLRININGNLNKNVSPKDIILYIIAKLGTNAGTGYFCEFAGNVIDEMSMEGRMTVCNMSIEMGARGGIIAPDKTTFEYLSGREFAPIQVELERKAENWEKLKTDEGAEFDKEYFIDADDIFPMITYGTNPGMGIRINEEIPISYDPNVKKALNYMGFNFGQSLVGLEITNVFIGSCTNARIEDLRIAAEYIKGKKKSDNVNALIVPGSWQVMTQLYNEGLKTVFEQAGFKIRQPGCSACLAMNEDKIPEGEYCVSTSNRNFEGRQGFGARTLLAAPLLAAACAVEGKIVDVTKIN